MNAALDRCHLINFNQRPLEIRECHVTCCCGTGGLALRLSRIVFASFSSLRKQQPSGFQGADRLIRCDGLPRAWTCCPLLPGEHCTLCWWARRALRSRFQQKQEVRIGGFLLPGPFFPPGPTQSQTQTMCVLTLWTSAYNRPGWLVGKCCGRLNNMRSQETFSPSLLPLLFESLLCVTPLRSLGESGKWFLSVSGLQRHSPPPWSFHWRLGTRWMWLGKYSSLSPGPKVISWYSSCHWLTRSRLRKMA